MDFFSVLIFDHFENQDENEKWIFSVLIFDHFENQDEKLIFFQF